MPNDLELTGVNNPNKITFGNNHIGIEASGGPTPIGKQDFTDVFSTEAGGAVTLAQAKAGLGVGLSMEISFDPTTEETNFTIGAAALFAGSISGSINADGSMEFTDWSVGVGGVFGAYVDTPVGGGGLAVEGSAGISGEDGVVHVGGRGEVSAGIMTVDGQASGHLGVAFDFGGLTDPDGGVNGANQASRGYGSAIVPLQTIEFMNNGLGVTIDIGNEFNSLDQIAEENWINNPNLHRGENDPSRPNGPNPTSPSEATPIDPSDSGPNSGGSGSPSSGGSSSPSEDGSRDPWNSQTVTRHNPGEYHPGVGQVWEPTGSTTEITTSYNNGTTTTNVTDSLGNGTFSSTDSRGNTTTYTQSGWGAEMPLVVDLDGDGVELSFGSSVYFDVDDDGYLEDTTWASGDDGFLVIDLSSNGSRGQGDGRIDQTKELILSDWGKDGDTDLQALGRAFDADGNFQIDKLDGDIWNELRIWQDKNQNGITDAGELFTLAGANTATAWYDTNGNGIVDDGERHTLKSKDISSINLKYDGQDSVTAAGMDAMYADHTDDITVFGNTLLGLASFTKADGTVVEGGIGDTRLRYSKEGFRQLETAIGYDMLSETGERLRYAVLEGAGSAQVNLGSLGLDGASGDTRNNLLNAGGVTAAVQLFGDGGNDTLYGGTKADVLAGGSGVDVLRGGDGDDILYFDAGDSEVLGQGGLDTGIITERHELDADGNLISSARGVSVNVSTSSLEVLYGGDGSDRLVANSSDTEAFSIAGGAGNDTIAGGTADDVISGDTGNDSLRGRGGNDTLIAGDGNDTLIGGSGQDRYILSSTGDTVVIETDQQRQNVLEFRDLNFEDINWTERGDTTRFSWGSGANSGSARIEGWNSFSSISFGGTSFAKLGTDSYGKWILKGLDSHNDFVSVKGTVDKRYYLIGGNGHDTLVANASVVGGGWNYMAGQAGNDYLTYYQAAGKVRVTSNGEGAGGGWDVFHFADVSFSDVTFGTRDGRQTIRWSKDGKSGEVELYDNGAYIEELSFAEGTRYQSVYENEHGNLVFKGADGRNDVVSAGGHMEKRYYLQGGSGDDTLVASASAEDSGRHYMAGQGGDDTYVYYSSAGDVRVTAWGEAPRAGKDTFRFADLNLKDVTFSLVAATKAEDGTYLQAAYMDESGAEHKVQWANEGGQINRFEFADGSSFRTVDFQSSERVELKGGDDDDVIYSTNSDSTYYLIGGAGNDTLIANTDPDGLQFLSGGEGDDEYVYYSSAGDVRVTAWGEPERAGMDTFRFADLNLADLTFSRVAAKKEADGEYLQISFTDEGGDLHTVQLANLGRQINFQKFADGSSFKQVYFGYGDRVELRGGDADEVIYSPFDGIQYHLRGGAGNDTLVANTDAEGFQYLAGGDGNDTYEYHSAAGDIRVSAWGEALGAGKDTFRFADLNLKDVTFSLVAATKAEDGTYLQAAFVDENGAKHKVQWANEGGQINRFEFADGSSFRRVKFDDDAGIVELEGFSGDDLIYSPTSTDDRYYLKGMEGNDTLVADTDAPGRSFMGGREGNDTYRYYADAGDMRISIWGEPDGFGSDRFIFEDLNLADVTFSTAPATLTADGIYLVATFTDANNDTHTVEFANKGGKINWFEFADGSVFDRILIEANHHPSETEHQILGTSGDDLIISPEGDTRYYLKGQDGDDTLIVQNDASDVGLLAGRNGDDTYIYYKSAGDVRISEWGEGAGMGDDTLRFADLNLRDVSFSIVDTGSYAGSLEIAFNDGSEHSIYIDKGGAYINRFEFADGSSFRRVKFDDDAGIVELEGFSGDDLIYSPTSTDDRYYLKGMEGNDTLVADTDAPGRSFMGGREGNDTYRYYSEAGDMRVSAWGEPEGEGTDTFIFEDLNLSDVTFSTLVANKIEDGTYLVVSFTDQDGNPHTVQFANEGRQINRFEFADGSSFKRVKFEDEGRVQLEGTDGANVIYSPNAAQADGYYLQGLEGNDTLVANTEGPGRQYMAGREGSDTYRYYSEAGDMRVSAWGEPEGAGTDTFIFEDLNLSDVTFSTTPAAKAADGIYLVVSFKDAGGTTHTVQFANEGKQINRFEFADGSSFKRVKFISGDQAQLVGFVGADVMNYEASSFAISMSGDEGNDQLLGGSGHDTLEGGKNNDSLEGGVGNDLIFLGSEFANDAGHDTAWGGEGNDSIVGTNGRSTVYGGAGNDTLSGGNDYSTADVDKLYGGDGDDSIVSGQTVAPTAQHLSKGDQLFGEQGNDTLIGGLANDMLLGGDGHDVLIGGDGADTLEGGKNNDSLEGGMGDDFIYLGSQLANDPGSDTAWGGEGNDSIVGTNGRSTVYGGSGNDTLSGGNDYSTADVDKMYGGDGDDLIISDQTVDPTETYIHKGDLLFGEQGNDSLIGGLANDRLDGGEGNDLLTGGGGADVFVFANSFGNDTITDFDHATTSSVIDLSAVAAITGFVDLTANHLSQSGTNAVIEDGSGNTITLLNLNKEELAEGDFLF